MPSCSLLPLVDGDTVTASTCSKPPKEVCILGNQQPATSSPFPPTVPETAWLVDCGHALRMPQERESLVNR